MSLRKHLLEHTNIILRTKEKKIVKEQIVPSGHNRDDYIVERLECAIVMMVKKFLLPLLTIKNKNRW